MKPKDLKEIIHCIVVGNEEKIHSVIRHRLSFEASTKLAHIFKCPLTITALDSRLHSIVSQYPEIFSLYGIRLDNSDWCIVYNNKEIFYKFYE